MTRKWQVIGVENGWLLGRAIHEGEFVLGDLVVDSWWIVLSGIVARVGRVLGMHMIYFCRQPR